MIVLPTARWLLKQTGVPSITQFPSAFLNELSLRLKTVAFSEDEEIISHAAYGESFYIVIGGSVVVRRGATKSAVSRTVSEGDPCAIVGLAACLPHEAFVPIWRQTITWSARSVSLAARHYDHRSQRHTSAITDPNANRLTIHACTSTIPTHTPRGS